MEEMAPYPNSLAVSAITGQGLDILLERIEGLLQSGRQLTILLIPYDRGDLVSMLHEQAIVNEETYQEDGVYLEAYIPHHLAGAVKRYQMETVEELPIVRD